MTFNKRMHPRNKYRSPPNFRQLAIEFEEFREFAVQDLSGKVSINFKNPAALRALTRVLLKKDWGLDIIIPPDRLVPTLPLRLNYLLWLEDIFISIKHNISRTPLRGIDIGTGAACIYPILAAKKNRWRMLATEIDENSYNHAVSNIKRNNLESLIKVQYVSGESPLKEALEKSSDGSSNEILYDFCMCNPPFFSNEDEMENSESGTGRSPERPRNPPRNARTGMVREVVVEGGEIGFVTKIIEEGKQLQDRVRILTTMLGHKSSVPRVTKILHDAGIQRVIQAEFCQGRTMRWGLAWSHTVDLTPAEKASQSVKKEKTRPPLQYLVPESCGETVEDVAKQILNILDSISVTHKLLGQNPTMLTYEVTANKNTWSNQRRKRREERRRQEEPASQCIGQSSTKDNEETKPVESVDTTKDYRKREAEDDSEKDTDTKRFKSDLPSSPLLIMTATIRTESGEDFLSIEAASRILLEVCWIGGTGGRELPHQVLQYIKNNLSSKEQVRTSVQS